MTLGEIKLEALRIMFVDAITLFEKNDALESLEEETECKDYLAGMPGAINRCFANLESRDILPQKRAVLSDFPGEKFGGRIRYVLSEFIPDFFKIERIVKENQRGGYDSSVDYSKEGDTLVIAECEEDERYIIIYRPKLQRVTALTDNETEIQLPDNIAALVPYFIKSELYRIDEPDEAQEARNWYEAGITEIAFENDTVQGRVKSVYSMEDV